MRRRPPGLAVELSGGAFAPSGVDSLLGLWGEVEDPGVPSFGIEAADSSLWRVDVSGDPQTASQWMAVSEARLQTSLEQMDVLEGRLDRALGQFGRVTFATGGVGPYDPAGAAPNAAAELELLAWLDNASRTQTTSDMPSFGQDDDQGRGWRQHASEELSRFLETVKRWCDPTARVETTADERLLAHSVVNWTGDLKTVCRADLAADQVALHERAVALVVRSRISVLRTVGTAARGVSEVAARLALPGGAILALPALWRFVNRLVGEAVAVREGAA